MSEHQEQVLLTRWVDRWAYEVDGLEMYFAVPNGGHRHKATAAKMKAEGQRAGVPDVLLLHPTDLYHGLALEMKYGKGKVRPTQQEWLTKFETRGYLTAVCYSWQEAAQVICDYLELWPDHQARWELEG